MATDASQYSEDEMATNSEDIMRRAKESEAFATITPPFANFFLRPSGKSICVRVERKMMWIHVSGWIQERLNNQSRYNDIRKRTLPLPGDFGSSKLESIVFELRHTLDA